jgi:hypothetical protein
MRLIDAGRLIKRLEQWNTNYAIDKAMYNFAMNRIMEQPIAYDVEEVVKELEHLKCYESTDYAISKAIEIVKGGVK